MIPEGWETFKIGDFININPRMSLRKEGIYSFIEMKDLNPSRKYVTPSCKKNLTGGSKFRNGDTLFARITPCLENGKICQARNLDENTGFGSTEFIILRGKEGISDSDFVYYLSRSEYIRNAAIQNMTGTSGRQRVENSAFAEIEFNAPSDLTLQSRIASFLSSLDDKIELNLRMNKTLESIAQAIFKEWFIDFRFPGFDGELVDVVNADRSVSRLPKGWGKGVLNDILTISKDTVMPSNSPSAEFCHYSIPAFDEGKSPKRELGKAILSNKFRVKKYSILLSKLNPRFPRLWAIGDVDENNSISSTEFIVLQPRKPIYYSFIVFYLRLDSTIERMAGLVTGTSSSHQRIRPLDIINLPIVLPNIEVVEKYERIVQPIFERTNETINENRILTELRDSLLPPLLSGKIRVA